MNGWKMKLGSILKGAAGAALGAVVAHIQAIPIDPTSKWGLGTSIALLFIGDAVKNYGLAHKLEKQTAAIEGQSEKP